MAKVAKEAKEKVWRRDRFICRYCRCNVGRPDESRPWQKWATVDHVLAKANGGSNALHNLVTACGECNAAKADMSEAQFRASLMPNAGRKHKRRVNPSDQHINAATQLRKQQATWRRWAGT